jgi:hypothetical protein
MRVVWVLLAIPLTALAGCTSQAAPGPYLTGSRLSALHAGQTAAFYMTAHNMGSVRPRAFFQFTGTGGWRVPNVTDHTHPGGSCGGDAPTMIVPYHPGVVFELGDFCRTAKLILLPMRPGRHTFTIHLYSQAQDNTRPPWGGTVELRSEVTQFRWRDSVLP